MQSTRRIRLLQIHIATVIMGGTGILGQAISLPPAQLAWIRTLLVAVVFCTIWLSRRSRHGFFVPGTLRLTCLYGVLLGLHWMAFFHSVKTSGVAVGVVTFSAFPFFAILLEAPLYRRSIDRIQFVAALSCILGSWFVAGGAPLDQADPSYVLGVGTGLASGLLFAGMTVVNERLVKLASPSQVALGQYAATAIFLTPFAWGGGFSGLDVTGWGLVIFLGACLTPASHWLILSSVRTLTSGTASLIMALEAVYGTVGAMFFLGEVPTAKVVLGGAIIVGSALIVSVGRRTGIRVVDRAEARPRG